MLIASASASEAIPDEAKAIIEKENRVPYEVMTRIIRQGQQEGSIRPYPAEALAPVFWTSIKGLSIHKAARGNAFKAPDAEILLHMFV